jgi:hypothetical protein
MALSFDQSIQVVQAAGAAATAAITVVALVLALRQLRSSQVSARESAAKDTFREFITTSFESPQQSQGDFNPANRVDDTKYLAFVILMLHAMEEVLAYCRPNEDEQAWLETVKFYLRRHKKICATESFQENIYATCSAPLQELIDVVAREPADAIKVIELIAVYDAPTEREASIR